MNARFNQSILVVMAVIFMVIAGSVSAAEAKGNLIIIGGGDRTEQIMQKFVELSGGKQARIAIIPTASEYYEESGREIQKEFLGYGVAAAQVFNIISREQADNDSIARALQNFDGYFFGGGDQSRLTRFFLGSKTIQLFHKQYQAGKTLGGTSAGAAIMSEVMITGDGSWKTMHKDSVVTTPGFGFVSNAIIDQHFVRRLRFNRLLNVVILNNLPGVGIDEATAVWVKPDGAMEVLGESVVMVLKPGLRTNSSNPTLLTGQGYQLDLYKNGAQFKL
jgi:cyanophycinase